MAKIAFGTDGWRSIIAEDFTFANVRIVAAAVADYLEGRGLGPRGIVVGYDNRFLSEHFAAAAAGVFLARGMPVMLGVRSMPTPVTAFAVTRYRAAGAVMLTASHNPPEYNGIKFIPEYGGPALPEVTRQIEANIRRYEQGDAAPPDEPWRLDELRRKEGYQHLLRFIDPRDDYISHVMTLIDGEAIREARLRVVADPLYGAGCGYLDRILRRLDVVVETLHDCRDALFGGRLPDPSKEKLELLRERVLAGGYDLGLGLDGDADRLGVIDADGSYISPNELLTLVYYHLLTVRDMAGPAARTVATTHMLDRIAQAYGYQVRETPVGFKYIGQCLMDGCIVGGEESGGMSVKGHVPEKDGIMAGLLAVEMVAVHGKSLRRLLAEVAGRFGPAYSGRVDVHTMPSKKAEVLEKLKGEPPRELGGKAVAGCQTMDGTKLLFDDGAWVLIRPSGTEPVFRIYAEAGSPEELARIHQAMREFAGL
ncbi:phosphoglucomutase/phosphomannomutase family protein [Desulforudis sp. 1088]|uniref:phosphoglucomutase/phosphomannomutase family protein n=1 Tax=unclassified Candidatus Desulforudis TaxID=2635950 RepID=UPI003CE5286E